MKKSYLIIATALVLLALIFVAGAASAAPPSDGVKHVTCYDDLAGARIGVQIGTTGDRVVTPIADADLDTTIERYTHIIDGIQTLKNGKLDCVVIDSETAKNYVTNGSGLKIITDPKFGVEEYAFAVKKGNTALQTALNNAIDELKADGTFDKINRYYLGQNGGAPYKKAEGINYTGDLKVATNAEFIPYEFKDGDNFVGIEMDFIQAIADKLHRNLIINDISFDSVLISIESGKDEVGAAGISVTEDRLKNVDFTKPYTTTTQVIIVLDTSSKNVVENVFSSIGEKFSQNFLEGGRYSYILQGLLNTIIIAAFSLLIGLVLGILIAVVRTIHDHHGKLTILNAVCKLYLTIIRGTPVLVQLLIIYYVIFATVDISKVLIASFAFGINSAAYVAEIIRAGINAVPKGQFEAGYSLGLPFKFTMVLIVLPQAVKNILPALCNEGITLLKETSISGYIGVVDLTKAGDIIRSQTFEAFMPLVGVAIMYLLMVMILTHFVNKLEKRMNNGNKTSV